MCYHDSLKWKWELALFAQMDLRSLLLPYSSVFGVNWIVQNHQLQFMLDYGLYIWDFKSVWILSVKGFSIGIQTFIWTWTLTQPEVLLGLRFSVNLLLIIESLFCCLCWTPLIFLSIHYCCTDQVPQCLISDKFRLYASSLQSKPLHFMKKHIQLTN